MNTPTAVVTVVCDNPKHARGKQFKMAAFIYGDPTGASFPPDWFFDIDRWMAYPEAAATRAMRVSKRTGSTEPACKLCGRQLPPYSDHIRKVLSQYAVEDKTTAVSLSVLLAMVINQEQV